MSKSSKIIPVMLVGKLVQHKSYSWAEYGEAALITMGVGIFSLNEKKPKAGEAPTQSASSIPRFKLCHLALILVSRPTPSCM